MAAALGAAALAGGVAIGGVMISGVASAQSPSPAPSTSPAPAPGQSGPGRTKAEYAARLAQALGIPQARVEAALQSTRAQHDGPGGRFDVSQLGPAAQALGVTPQQLADAIGAAAQARMQARQPGQPRPTPGQRPDETAFFAAIAQNLGRNITAQQVQTALQSLHPDQANRPTPEQMQAQRNQRLATLAQALGVTTEQLTAALQSIGGPGGHGDMPGMPGGRHSGR